jgi:hypothetical protein
MGACGVRDAKVERLLQLDSALAVGTNALVKGSNAAANAKQIARSIIIVLCSAVTRLLGRKKMWLLAAAVAACFILRVAVATTATNSPWTMTSNSRMQHKKAIVIDCDGTLYGPDAGVEQQIVASIHRFGKNVLSLSAADCDELHAR